MTATAAGIPYEDTDCTADEAVEAVKAVRTTAAPLRIERLVNELAAGTLDVDTFMERLDALVASPPLDTEKIARARLRWRAVL